MTLPANIRVNIGAPFPSLVKGSGPVTISKQNGIWTVGFTIANLAGVPGGTDPATLLLFLYNTVNQTFQQMSVASLLASLAINPTTITPAQSPYVPLITDSVLYVNTTTGPVTINLTTAAARLNRPLSIKDIGGIASQAGHNISINPSGAETIEGGAQLVINANYGGFRLYPATLKYIIAP